MPGFGEVGELLRRSTVHVRDGRNSSGSGVIWDSTGALITNAHVARGERLEVQLWDGRTLPATLDKRDARRDLALLRIDAPQLQALTIGDSTRVRIGELAIAVGNPLGFTGALSTGVVHGVGRIPGLGTIEYIQAALRLAPGNSGGPLADASGKLLGINTMVVSGGLALAIPSHTVGHFIASGPPVELGVTVRPVRIPGEQDRIGLIVLALTPGSPAERSSLQVGDVLTGTGEREFRSADDLAGALDGDPGRLIRLRFLRGGQKRRREVAVQLAPSGVAA